MTRTRTHTTNEQTHIFVYISLSLPPFLSHFLCLTLSLSVSSPLLFVSLLPSLSLPLMSRNTLSLSLSLLSRVLANSLLLSLSLFLSLSFNLSLSFSVRVCCSPSLFSCLSQSLFPDICLSVPLSLFLFLMSLSSCVAFALICLFYWG